MSIVDMSDLNREDYTKKEWKKEYDYRYRLLNKERIKKRKKLFHQIHLTEIKQRIKKYQQTKKYKETRKRYTETNKYKDIIKNWNQSKEGKEAQKRYVQSERGKAQNSKKCMKRHAQKLNATVAWADENKILAIYLRAQRKTKQTGKQHDVDHLLPLQNINVCGLHCESNLRVILAKTNNVKYNSFTPKIEKRVIQLMTQDQLKLSQ